MSEQDLHDGRPNFSGGSVQRRVLHMSISAAVVKTERFYVRIASPARRNGSRSSGSRKDSCCLIIEMLSPLPGFSGRSSLSPVRIGTVAKCLNRPMP